MSQYAVTWDYRCPFARNAHEHIAAALVAGAEWEVEFLPFSLSQAHVPDGGTPVWEDPAAAGNLLALGAGVVVRDRYPDRFLEAHVALFAARHDEGLDLRRPEVLTKALDGLGLPGAEVVAQASGADVVDELRRAHERAVDEWEIFGVPTFVVGDRAVFVRLMSRPKGDAALARRTIDGVLGLFDAMPDLNEFKHTTIGK